MEATLLQTAEMQYDGVLKAEMYQYTHALSSSLDTVPDTLQRKNSGNLTSAETRINDGNLKCT